MLNSNSSDIKNVTIATWNVNSINVRMAHLSHFIENYNPDIILLQELKCSIEKFPYQLLDDLYYNYRFVCQKSYNGVAILSKYRIEEVVVPHHYDVLCKEPRYIEGLIIIHNVCLRVASVYVPNGSALESEKFYYKLDFLNQLAIRLDEINKSNEFITVGGDFNVATEIYDVVDCDTASKNPGFEIRERTIMRTILNNGMLDSWRLHNIELKHQFTWWDYRTSGFKKNKGMRIDTILISPNIANKMINAYICKEIRAMDRPSDHAPVIIHLEI